MARWCAGADLDEILESYELRATLETRALHLAVPYGDPLISDLQACLAEMTRALDGGDPSVTSITPCAFIAA